MYLNQSPTDPESSAPLKGLKKVSIKFQGQKAAGVDPTTGTPIPASGPSHGLAEISLESHAPNQVKDGGMSKESAPTPEQFGGGTKLDPMHEALFPSWMRANGVDPGSIDGHTYDYRGAYQQTNGQIHPPGTLQSVADKINKLHQTLANPVTSHPPTGGLPTPPPPQLTSPGIPSMGDALQSKVGDLRQYGATPDQEPLRMLLNLLQQQRGGGQ